MLGEEGWNMQEEKMVFSIASEGNGDNDDHGD